MQLLRARLSYAAARALASLLPRRRERHTTVYLVSVVGLLGALKAKLAAIHYLNQNRSFDIQLSLPCLKCFALRSLFPICLCSILIDAR